MRGPENSEGNPEAPLTKPELVRKFASLYSQKLLFQELWRNADLTDDEFERMYLNEKDLKNLTIHTLPRIKSGEIDGFTLRASPIDTHFYLVLPGGRLRISMEIESIESGFPNLREMIMPYKNPDPSSRLPHKERSQDLP